MQIYIQDLSVKIVQKTIIQDVSMSINKKEFVGIIGPNGSGKSTLLKSIYRTIKPSTGNIYFDNKVQTEISIKESAQKLAVVSQHNQCSFDFSVMDVVLMGRSPYKNILSSYNQEDYDIAHSSLDVVGMKQFAERSFSTLSGGEQQRVILARALTQKTKCIVLDEPTNHLDLKYQLQLMKVIKNLNISIIAAVHDLNIACMYCDRLYAIKDGKIIGSGTPQELLTTEFIYILFGVKTDVIHNKGQQVIIYRRD